MKRRLTRRRLVRPADAFLPLALLAACLCGFGTEAVILFLCALGIRLCALSSAGSLRAAFALQPSMRDVRGSVKCSLLAQLVGGALAAILLRLFSAEWIRPPCLAFLGAGLLLNLEHVFYEYLYSAGDGGSALLSRAITAGLTFAGLWLTPTVPAALPACAGAALLASCAVALAIGGGLKGRMNARPLRCAPAFLLQDLLYPAAFLLLTRLPLAAKRGFEGLSFTPWDAALFAGLAVYSLCRAPFRRSRAEAAPMNRALLVVSAIGVLIAVPALVWPEAVRALPTLNGYGAGDLPVLGAALLLACLCGFVLFGNAGRAE